MIEINGKPLMAWLYRGGLPDDVIELLCERKLSAFLALTKGQNVTIVVEEVPEGTPGMPAPPPKRPGRKVI